MTQHWQQIQYIELNQNRKFGNELKATLSSFQFESGLRIFEVQFQIYKFKTVITFALFDTICVTITLATHTKWNI